jgi:predicted ABC-type ATPase
MWQAVLALIIVDQNEIKWARRNKKKIAREYLRKIHPANSESPVGIFMAGLPGAGKTEFSQELIQKLNTAPLRIDMDEIATRMEGYSPLKANLFRSGASIILAKIYDEATKSKVDFIFDGTFAHANALLNIKRAQDHKYIIKIYYIYQDPVLAWQFTKARETLEKRGIERTDFIDSYFHLQENLRKLQDGHRNVTISIILKDTHNQVGQLIEDVQNIEQYVPMPLDRDYLERVIVE